MVLWRLWLLVVPDQGTRSPIDSFKMIKIAINCYPAPNDDGSTRGNMLPGILRRGWAEQKAKSKAGQTSSCSQECPRHALDSVAQYAIFAKFWPYYTFCAQAILGQEVKIGLSSMWLIFCKSRLMDTAMSRQPNKRTDNLIPNNKFWSCSDQEYLIALINSFRLWHSLKLILWLKSYSIHLHKRW